MLWLALAEMNSSYYLSAININQFLFVFERIENGIKNENLKCISPFSISLSCGSELCVFTGGTTCDIIHHADQLMEATTEL